MTRFCNDVNTDLICEANYTDAILVCKLCGNECLSDSINCSPYELKECTYRQVLGLWAVFINIFGVLGNMLTLLAIPYAARKRRFILIHFLSIIDELRRIIFFT